ncbi:MAG: hypothetical protein ABSG43_07780 [Solirubrobacteraceae bacterium]
MIIWGLPTSAMAGGGCLAAFSRRNQIPCPTQETRDVYFGLLGPETASLSYVSGGGRTVTVPTVGPDGAYLIVTRARPGEQQGTSIAAPRPYPCGPIGLVPAKAPHLTQGALASAIHVREMPASSSTPPQLLFKIGYTARVAVTSTNSFYSISLLFPNVRTCHEFAVGTETTTNIRAGEQLVDNEQVLASCHGIIRGLVRYHPASAIHSAAPEPDPTNPGDITVGRFSLLLP